MPEHDEIGRRLHDAQRGEETARLDLLRAKEQLERNRAVRRRVERFADPENPQHRATLEELDRREAEIEASIGARGASRKRASARLDGLIAEFLPFTDPRDNLSAKSPEYPFLLFPLRLETRFKKIQRDNATVDQLWVRVFPDDCLVDTFEETPADSEILSAKKFWVDWVAAGGNDDQQRGAWRSLVAGSGAGRSAWLLQQYGPDASVSFPQKSAPTDIVLVVATEQPLPAAEKPAIETFWKALWLAADDAALQQAAYAAFETAVGTERAAVVFAQHAPQNLTASPTPPLGRADVALHLAFLELPDSTLFESQRLPWSQAPRVRILPERFVLLGYNDGKNVLERLGAPVPSELIAGPDPLAEPADQMHLEDGDLVVGAEMKWMVDFDEAVRVGLGFRVDLSPVEARRGFDQLMVVGARLSADEADGKELLETLFHHHEAGNSGFSLLPPGDGHQQRRRRVVGLLGRRGFGRHL